MRYTLTQINATINGRLIGDEETEITGVGSLEEAGKGDITFIKNESLIDMAHKTNASAIVTPCVIEGFAKPYIVCEDPFLAFVKFLDLISAENNKQTVGIHPAAVIAKTTKLGSDVSIGPNVVVQDGVTVGNGAVICANVFIGKDSSIGDKSMIFANVTIQSQVKIGKRATIHSGTVIGTDGFGYLQKNGKHIKIPQVGGVEIGDDVEIGANVTIDRAALDKTVIGNGVKIDNHSHVAHNVTIGNDSMLVAYAKIAGGAKIGKNVMIAEDVGINDHSVIGDKCIVGGGSNVYGSLKPGSVVWGSPARPLNEEKKIQAIITRLPDIRQKVKELSKQIRDQL